MTPLTTPTGLRLLALALGAGLLVGGCAAATADQGPGSEPVASADFGPDGPGPSDTPDPALSGQPVPTLPPGDPGTGTADETEDGHDGEDGHHEDDEHGTVTDVPLAALLDAGTVGALAGGTWATDAKGAEACLTGAPDGAAASRSAVLVSDDGRLVQSVSTWPGPRAAGKAKVAVGALAAELVACGFTEAGDPRLGDASTALERTSGTDGAAGTTERAVVIAAEGATMVLTGAGTAGAEGVWESLSDVAMGTLCAAGAHGCH